MLRCVFSYFLPPVIYVPRRCLYSLFSRALIVPLQPSNLATALAHCLLSMAPDKKYMFFVKLYLDKRPKTAQEDFDCTVNNTMEGRLLY